MDLIDLSVTALPNVDNANVATSPPIPAPPASSPAVAVAVGAGADTEPRGPPPAYDAAVPAAGPGPAAFQPQTVKVKLGNSAAPNPHDGSKTDWEFFVGVDGAATPVIDRVEIHLHPSFSPTHYTLTAADAGPDGLFRLRKTGWGVFEIAAEIHWTAAVGGRSTLMKHMLQFQHDEAMVMWKVALPVVAGTPRPPAGLAAPPPPPPPPRAGPPPPPLPRAVRQQTSPRKDPRGRRNRGAAAAGAAVEAKREMPVIDTEKERDDKHTVIAMVVDRSGSMSKMGAEVEGGCNAYLDEQRTADVEDGATTTVLLSTFDNSVERVLDGVDLTTVSPVTHAQVEPRGMTALYDGIGDTLVRTAQLVNSMEKMPAVTMFILTDGAENASKTWNKAAVSEQIKRLSAEPYGWDFYFAAANQDALKEGSSMGMDRGKCMAWGHEGKKMASAMKVANMAYQRKKKGFSDGSYLAEERSACM
mmetsp:Transcript_17234/g.50907  ORF Transcript_17234/g.50907 Transcript_17234/m.50907 type:complete len:472 (-) Transcript_17234:4086-5501(-)